MTRKQYLTHQEIYDRVKTHLLTQNCKASDGDVCYYRMDSGLSCAVGCLVPQEAYDPTIERLGIRNCIEFRRGDTSSALGRRIEKFRSILRQSGVSVNKKDRSLDLLQQLQEIHDLFTPDAWGELLTSLANSWDLQP